MVHQVVDAVYRKFQVEISSDQVKYVMKYNSIRNKEREVQEDRVEQVVLVTPLTFCFKK